MIYDVRNLTNVCLVETSLSAKSVVYVSDKCPKPKTIATVVSTRWKKRFARRLYNKRRGKPTVAAANNNRYNNNNIIITIIVSREISNFSFLFFFFTIFILRSPAAVNNS